MPGLKQFKLDTCPRCGFILGTKITFSPREVDTLRALLKGLPNTDIGKELGIETRTVKAHTAKMFRKTGARNRIALVNWYHLNKHRLQEVEIVIHNQKYIGLQVKEEKEESDGHVH